MGLLYSHLIHLCNIKRPGHAIVSQKKQPTESTVGTDIECRIEPAGDSTAFTLLGRTSSESYRGFFRGDEDLRIGDKVVWTSRTPNVTFIVEGPQELTSGSYPGVDEQIEVALKKMHVE